MHVCSNPPETEGRGGTYLAFFPRSRGRSPFSQCLPSVATGYQNRLKVLYSQKATPGSSRKTCRYIPSLPDRILDAPEIRNDYCKCSRLFAPRMEEEGLGTGQTRKLPCLLFPALADLNLVDWSSANVLAVALDNSVYLWSASSGDILQLLQMEQPGDYISSVAWIKEGNYLAVGTSSAEVQVRLTPVLQFCRAQTQGACPAGGW